MIKTKSCHNCNKEFVCMYHEKLNEFYESLRWLFFGTDDKNTVIKSLNMLIGKYCLEYKLKGD